ncbi:hypothetical protein R3P38DRAFT_2811032 [Favolaschia claudopus]|uniref:Uncharacterized protein n=1 Tax=Favolaschia claudopus TaxID=2862362 RepID=A0AAV9Z9R4_9AGAR
MRSFAFAALSLAVAAFAAPIVNVDAEVAADLDLVLRDDLVSLPAIIDQVMSQLAPVTGALSSIVAANATQEVIQPLTDEITSILTGAVSQISNLAGQPVSDILATADGVLDATGVAQLLAPVFTTVSGAAQNVLNLVENGPVGDIVVPLLNDALAALDPVLTTVAPLVNGLLAALAPILGPVVNTLNGLGLGPVVQLLGSIL